MTAARVFQVGRLVHVYELVDAEARVLSLASAESRLSELRAARPGNVLALVRRVPGGDALHVFTPDGAFLGEDDSRVRLRKRLEALVRDCRTQGVALGVARWERFEPHR